MVDEDEAFVSDGTGMHPTRTTFATTVVESSLAFGDETVVPTPDSYHRVELDTDVRIFNSAVGDGLTFSDSRETWSNYNQHEQEYHSTTWSDGSTKLNPWVEGFSTPYSWDYKSPLTSNEYVNLCPALIYHDGSRTQYYFFREVFDDFQAYHGFANWSRKKDGFPGPDWPGMIKVVRSIAGLSQRPKRRSEYEQWFGIEYGNGYSYAAPYMNLVSKMPLVPPPTRFRYADPSREPRDVVENVVTDISPYKLAEMLESLPSFPKYNENVNVGAAGTVVRNTGSTSADSTSIAVDRSTPWLLFADGVVPGGWSATYSSQSAAQQATGKTLAVLKPSDTSGKQWWSTSYVGSADYWYNDPAFKTYSAFLRVGTPTQLVGYFAKTNGSGRGAAVVASPYGLTSTSPSATFNSQTSALVPSPGGLAGVLAILPYNECIAFIYDASVGNYGEVQWISQI